MTVVPYFAPEISRAAPSMVMGATTVLVIVVAPGGIVGMARAVRRRHAAQRDAGAVVVASLTRRAQVDA